MSNFQALPLRFLSESWSDLSSIDPVSRERTDVTRLLQRIAYKQRMYWYEREVDDQGRQTLVTYTRRMEIAFAIIIRSDSSEAAAILSIHRHNPYAIMGREEWELHERNEAYEEDEDKEI